MNLSFWKVQRKSAEIVQTNWILHLTPPVVQVETTGTIYRVTATGVTYRMVKPLPEQITGCPFPGLVLELSVRGFLYRHRAKWPLVLVAVALFVVSLYALSVWLMMEHPAAGEMVQNTLWSALLWTIGIGAAGFGLRMAYGFGKSAKYVWETETLRAVQVKELPMGEPDALDISPDVFVIQKEGEEYADFEARVAGVQANLEPGVWAVALAFRDRVGCVLKSLTTSTEFNREDPPFEDESTPEEMRLLPANAIFDKEEYPDFMWYCNEFAARYRRWASAQKVKEAGTAGNTVWRQHLRARSLNVIFFLLFAVGLSAQSAEKARVALGTHIREIPEQGADVSFMFEKKVMSRVGNGKSDYVKLLTDIPGYRDCCHGSLVAIYKNGRAVVKAEAVEDVAAPTTRQAAMRPVSAIPPEQVQPGSSWSMPDSASIANSLNNAGDDFDFYRTELWRSSRPIWGFLMRIFWGIIPLFVVIGFIAKYIASTGNEEDFYGISFIGRFIMGAHESASGVSLLICWGITIVAFINEFMWLVYTQRPLWLMLVFLFPTYWLAKGLTNWWVPNPPGSRGVGGKQSRRGNYDPGTLQIPSGR